MKWSYLNRYAAVTVASEGTRDGGDGRQRRQGIVVGLLDEARSVRVVPALVILVTPRLVQEADAPARVALQKALLVGYAVRVDAVRRRRHHEVEEVRLNEVVAAAADAPSYAPAAAPTPGTRCKCLRKVHPLCSRRVSFPSLSLAVVDAVAAAASAEHCLVILREISSRPPHPTRYRIIAPDTKAISADERGSG